MGDDAGPEPLLEWGMVGWPRRVGAWAVVTGGLMLATYLVLRAVFDTGLRVDPVRVTVQGPSPLRGTWRWDELLEVAVGRHADAGGPGVAVRPRGSTWDTPGPLAPAFAYLRRGHSLAHVQEVLEAECARHGVPFTTHADGFGTARPGSPLRRDG